MNDQVPTILDRALTRIVQSFNRQLIRFLRYPLLQFTAGPGNYSAGDSMNGICRLREIRRQVGVSPCPERSDRTTLFLFRSVHFGRD